MVDLFGPLVLQVDVDGGVIVLEVLLQGREEVDAGRVDRGDGDVALDLALDLAEAPGQVVVVVDDLA